MINPFKSYLTENSDKIKKQAFDQIYSSINPEKRKKVERSSTIVNALKESIFGFNSNSLNVNNNQQSQAAIELEALTTRYNQSNSNFNSNIESFNKTKENFEQFMKFFKDSCEVNNILTLDQKIDYYVHLRNTTSLKKEQCMKILYY